MNIAETELNVLSRQCLSQMIRDKQMLEKEIAAWANDRNASQTSVNWQFTTKDARIKLKRLYQ